MLSRSSHWRCSVRKGVLRNFTIFTGKHLHQCLILIKLKKNDSKKIFFKKPLQHRCFPVNIVNFWHLVGLLTVVTFLRTRSIKMGFWFILVASIIVTWPSLFSGHRFKLESEDFIFHILQRNFSNFGMKIGVQQKVFRAFIFPYFVLSWYILVQSLLERFPKRIYFFSFSILKWHIFV